MPGARLAETPSRRRPDPRRPGSHPAGLGGRAAPRHDGARAPDGARSMGSGRALLARLRHLHRSRRCRAVLRDDGVDALARAVRRGHGRLAAGARRDRARRRGARGGGERRGAAHHAASGVAAPGPHDRERADHGGPDRRRGPRGRGARARRDDRGRATHRPGRNLRRRRALRARRTPHDVRVPHAQDPDGRLPAEWRGWLRTAIERGLEIWSGLHTFIGDDPELGALARERGVRIFDARRPPANLPVADGLAAEVDAYVVHTVGSDCNVGKMTAQVELRNALIARGHRTRFVATGQTGIFIEGWGIAVDAVVADFIAGASEWLVLEAAKDADIILVEGQGSLIHPGYSGVTLGLLHGCCPDALILCHQATRDHIGDYHGREPWVKIPPLPELVEIYEHAAAPVRPTKVIGICLNTFDMSEAQARDAVARAADETGLPATDPVRFGSAPLVDAIIQGAMAAK